jgi:hypothetical protein
LVGIGAPIWRPIAKISSAPFRHRYFAVPPTEFSSHTGSCVNERDEDINDLIKSGMITLNRSNQILIPFPYFYKIINESQKMTKEYFIVPFTMDSESFEEIFLEILSFKLTKGYSIGNALKLEDLFHGAYMSPRLKNLKIKTQTHVSYICEKNWYYKDGKIIEQSEIDALYPNSNAVITVRKHEFPEFQKITQPLMDGTLLKHLIMILMICLNS